MKNKYKDKSLSLVLFVILMIQSFSIMAKNDECDFQKVSNKIYVIFGSDHSKCPIKEIEHPLTNPAAIIGETGIVIIDPGSSLQVGRLVLNRLKKISDKPVVAVFNTHIHGLYWLGNHAIKEKYPKVAIYAHKNMIKRIKSGEGDFWINAITGKYKGENTRFITPAIELSGGEQLNLAGLQFKIHHPGHGHTDHDLVIELKDDNAVFLGGLVVEPEVPSEGVPRDANFEGQIKSIQYAIDINADIYIPGRGMAADIKLPKRSLKFLKALYSGVQKYYDEGYPDYKITKKLKKELSSYKQWYNFTRLGGVISQMYLQVEEKSF